MDTLIQLTQTSPNKMPPCQLYGDLVYLASDKLGKNPSECRKLYGQFTLLE